MPFVLSVGLRERGDTRETATDGREGGEQRGGLRDAQAEEPPALLSLPNQTRAGAAGTGLLPLRSVPSCVNIKRCAYFHLHTAAFNFTHCFAPLWLKMCQATKSAAVVF